MILSDRISSNLTGTWLAIFSVAALAPNTFFCFESFSQLSEPYRTIQAGFVAFLLSFGILFFTIRGGESSKKTAKTFFRFEVLVSTYYYCDSLLSINDGFHWNWAIIPALAFGIMLPTLVMKYSEIDFGSKKEEFIQRFGNGKKQEENGPEIKNTKDIFVKSSKLEGGRNANNL